jgi:hypothetical protein
MMKKSLWTIPLTFVSVSALGCAVGAGPRSNGARETTAQVSSAYGGDDGYDAYAACMDSCIASCPCHNPAALAEHELVCDKQCQPGGSGGVETHVLHQDLEDTPF